MATAPLTPQSNQNPAVVNASKELSGPQWVGRFMGSSSTNDLGPAFKSGVEAFVRALINAGATVTIAATFRPPERAYLMHWSWKIVHGTRPADVPAHAGVNIEWGHPTEAASVQAAAAMVAGFGMQNLQVPPSLSSRHTQRAAVDMSVTWAGTLTIVDANGTVVTIASTPRDGMNPDLHRVGKTYGVIKFVGGASDRPHWSTDGH